MLINDCTYFIKIIGEYGRDVGRRGEEIFDVSTFHFFSFQKKKRSIWKNLEQLLALYHGLWDMFGEVITVSVYWLGIMRQKIV